MKGKKTAAVCPMIFTAIVAAGGCFSPKYREALPCSGLDDCPPGQTCAYTTCVACQSIESCNSVDDDCDGLIDEGGCECVDGDRMQCGLQACPGESTCANGEWGPCEGARQPHPDEICVNSVDDDCNGEADDGCPCKTIGEVLDTNCGPCQDGIQRCTSTGLGPCESASPKIDCCPADSRTCGTATGTCSTGTEACTAAGRWSGVCSGTGPQPEACNGLDDDCDESTDETPQCQACLPVGNILVHDMAPPAAGDDEFSGHGPFVRITTSYFIVGGGSQVCANVLVTMQETGGDASLARKPASACSEIAPGTIAEIMSENTIHTYTDDDTSAGGVWDEISPLTDSIGSIRCVGDTGGADICNGGSNFTDCSKCELLNVCPYVKYRP